MDLIKKLFYRIFHIPAPAVIILVMIAVVSFFPVLNYEGEYRFVAYFIYVFYAYVLVLVILSSISFVKKTLKFIRSIPLGEKYLDDKLFRGRIGLYFGGIANLLFILFNFFSGIYYRSVWFISIGFFYMGLVFIKRKLAMAESRTLRLPEKEKRLAEIKAYIQTGALLFVLAFFIAGIGIQVIRKNQSYTYNQFLIYGVGAYAFYYLGITIYNMVFFKKKDSFIWSAVQAVNFTTALLGIFSFQTALLTQVSTEESAQFFNILTLAGVLFLIVAKAVYMVIKGINNQRLLIKQKQ